MEKTKLYQELVKPYQEEMMKSLKEFIAIDSVYDEDTKDDANPFGKGVSKALQYIADLAKKDGFIVHNYDNMVVEILTNELGPNVTIMAHADVDGPDEGLLFGQDQDGFQIHFTGFLHHGRIRNHLVQ